MGEIQKNRELEAILDLDKTKDFVEFKIPNELYNTACRDCVFKKNGCCTGYCIKKFISGSP